MMTTAMFVSTTPAIPSGVVEVIERIDIGDVPENASEAMYLCRFLDRRSWEGTLDAFEDELTIIVDSPYRFQQPMIVVYGWDTPFTPLPVMQEVIRLRDWQDWLIAHHDLWWTRSPYSADDDLCGDHGENEPTCDFCDRGQCFTPDMEWNGFTGNHVECETLDEVAS